MDGWIDTLLVWTSQPEAESRIYILKTKTTKLKGINYNRFKKFKRYNYKGYLQKIYKIRTKIYLKKKLVTVRMSLPEGIGN